MHTLQFNDRELELVESAVRGHLNVFGHEQAQLIHELRLLLDKIQAAHVDDQVQVQVQDK